MKPSEKFNRCASSRPLPSWGRGKLSRSVACLLAFSCFLTWTIPSYALKPIEAQESKDLLAELREQLRQVVHAAGFPLTPAATPQRSVRPLEKRWGQTLAAAGLEEDPLLKIWEGITDRRPFMARLEKPLFEQWDSLWPSLKQFLEDPDSPIPHPNLWRVLAGTSFEQRLQQLDPSQWLWLVNFALTRWGDPDLDRPSQIQTLNLLGVLDRALLDRLVSMGPDAGQARDLILAHLRIIESWHEGMREDPHRLSEQLVVTLLRSLAKVGPLPPKTRQKLWPDPNPQHSFDLIREIWHAQNRPAVWETPHLSREHLPLLAQLPPETQAALFDAVLPALLHRTPAGYDSMGELHHAGSLVGLWVALPAQPPELQQAFLASLARRPVRELLDPLLEIAGDSPEARTLILRFLVVVLNLKSWHLSDQDIPLINLLYLMNRIDTLEQHQLLRELHHQLLGRYSGRIGVPRSSPIRPLTRPVEDPDSFGPDLNGFIRREVHHLGGAHGLDLVGLRLHWWITDDKVPLEAYLARLGTPEAQATLAWLQDYQRAPEAEQLGPAVRLVMEKVALKLGQPETELSVEVLATVSEEILEEVAAELRDAHEGVTRLFEREIPAYRILWGLYGPKTAESVLAWIKEMSAEYRSEVWWPAELIQRFLGAFESRDNVSALEALAELQAACCQRLLGVSDYLKWTVTMRDAYERDMLNKFEFHHGIPAVRGYNPQDPNFQLYILLERLRPLTAQLTGRLIQQAQTGAEWEDQVSLLHGQIRWLQAVGYQSRQLRDLSDLLQTSGLTRARLQLVSRRLVAYVERAMARQDGRVGLLVDAVASVLGEERPANPRILESLGLKQLPPERGSWEPRLRPHLERQLLARQEALSSARVLATQLYERLDQLTSGELLKPIVVAWDDDDFIQVVPLLGWLPLSVAVPSQVRLADVGLKARNLILMRAAGDPVPPAAIHPIVRDAQAVIRMSQSGIQMVERQVEEQGLQDELGAHFGDPSDPLLISVRSGALLDMPGQLPTIENVGINLKNLPALAKRIGEWGAWDAYRRFIQVFAMTVWGEARGFHREFFDEIIEGYKLGVGVERKIQLSAEQMREIALMYLDGVSARAPRGIPEDPWEQLTQSIQAVVNSWNWPRVRAIREVFDLSHEQGTAVILQVMVYGNYSLDEGQQRSGAGVVFTSQDGPEGVVSGSFGQAAQGSDVAEGVITPEPLDRLQALMPEVYDELSRRALNLQERVGEEREIEFTVQRETLWMLQDRTAPLRGPAARFLHEAVGRYPILAAGTGLAGGAVRGVLALPEAAEDPDRFRVLQQAAAARGVEGILLAMDTATPEDTPLLRKPGVVGFLAKRGGRGQHEGLVANLLGLTAVSGLQNLEKLPAARGVRFGGKFYAEGDVVSVDGLSGVVYGGKVPLSTTPLYGMDVPPEVPEAGLEEGPTGSQIKRELIYEDDGKGDPHLNSLRFVRHRIATLLSRWRRADVEGGIVKFLARSKVAGEQMGEDKARYIVEKARKITPEHPFVDGGDAEKLIEEVLFYLRNYSSRNPIPAILARVDRNENADGALAQAIAYVVEQAVGLVDEEKLQRELLRRFGGPAAGLEEMVEFHPEFPEAPEIRRAISEVLAASALNQNFLVFPGSLEEYPTPDDRTPIGFTDDTRINPELARIATMRFLEFISGEESHRFEQFTGVVPLTLAQQAFVDYWRQAPEDKRETFLTGFVNNLRAYLQTIADHQLLEVSLEAFGQGPGLLTEVGFHRPFLQALAATALYFRGFSESRSAESEQLGRSIQRFIGSFGGPVELQPVATSFGLSNSSLESFVLESWPMPEEVHNGQSFFNALLALGEDPRRLAVVQAGGVTRLVFGPAQEEEIQVAGQAIPLLIFESYEVASPFAWLHGSDHSAFGVNLYRPSLREDTPPFAEDLLVHISGITGQSVGEVPFLMARGGVPGLQQLFNDSSEVERAMEWRVRAQVVGILEASLRSSVSQRPIVAGRGEQLESLLVGVAREENRPLPLGPLALNRKMGLFAPEHGFYPQLRYMAQADPELAYRVLFLQWSDFHSRTLVNRLQVGAGEDLLERRIPEWLLGTAPEQLPQRLDQLLSDDPFREIEMILDGLSTELEQIQSGFPAGAENFDMDEVGERILAASDAADTRLVQTFGSLISAGLEEELLWKGPLAPGGLMQLLTKMIPRWWEEGIVSVRVKYPQPVPIDQRPDLPWRSESTFTLVEYVSEGTVREISDAIDLNIEMSSPGALYEIVKIPGEKVVEIRMVPATPRPPAQRAEGLGEPDGPKGPEAGLEERLHFDALLPFTYGQRLEMIRTFSRPAELEGNLKRFRTQFGTARQGARRAGEIRPRSADGKPEELHRWLLDHNLTPQSVAQATELIHEMVPFDRRKIVYLNDKLPTIQVFHDLHPDAQVHVFGLQEYRSPVDSFKIRQYLLAFWENVVNLADRNRPKFKGAVMFSTGNGIRGAAHTIDWLIRQKRLPKGFKIVMVGQFQYLKEGKRKKLQKFIDDGILTMVEPKDIVEEYQEDLGIPSRHQNIPHDEVSLDDIDGLLRLIDWWAEKHNLYQVYASNSKSAIYGGASMYEDIWDLFVNHHSRLETLVGESFPEGEPAIVVMPTAGGTPGVGLSLGARVHGADTLVLGPMGAVRPVSKGEALNIPWVQSFADQGFELFGGNRYQQTETSESGIALATGELHDAKLRVEITSASSVGHLYDLFANRPELFKGKGPMNVVVVLTGRSYEPDDIRWIQQKRRELGLNLAALKLQAAGLEESARPLSVAEQWGYGPTIPLSLDSGQDHRAVLHHLNPSGDRVLISLLKVWGEPETRKARVAIEVMNLEGDKVPENVVAFRGSALRKILGEIVGSSQLANVWPEGANWGEIQNPDFLNLLGSEAMRPVLEKNKARILRNKAAGREGRGLTTSLKQEEFVIFFDVSGDDQAQWHPFAQMGAEPLLNQKKVRLPFSAVRTVEINRESRYFGPAFPEEAAGLEEVEVREELPVAQQAKIGHAVDAAIGLVRHLRPGIESPYLIVAIGITEVEALLEAGVHHSRIVALVENAQQKDDLVERGFWHQHVYHMGQFSNDPDRARRFIWRVTSDFLRTIEGVEVTQLTAGSRNAQLLLAELQGILRKYWPKTESVTAEEVEQILRLFQLGV